MKFPQIIDNRAEEARLDFVLNRIILPYATDLRVAVGYFYLSGYELLLEGLRNCPALAADSGAEAVRFLISPRTDRTTAAVLAAGHAAEGAPTDAALRQRILREFEVDLAHVKSDAMEALLAHLVSGRITVRLCVGDFFHAKAYLARTEQGGIQHYYSIVGSSNFSAGGLTGNHELNLGTTESGNYDHLVRWFDDIWTKDSVEFNQSLIRVIESSVGSRKHAAAQQALDPFAMLLFLVRHYLGDLVEEQIRESSQLAEFQRIGAENVLDKLERLGGAIVSDSVGLGKTYTAAEVIRRYRVRGKSVLIVAPPYVLPQWRETLSTAFGIPESAHVILLSQGKLAQMKDSELFRTFGRQALDLIVIDEAHRARNTETRLYHNIKQLHRGSERSDMLLLTATPFNNSVLDLANLVDLAVLRNTLTNHGFFPDAFRQLRDHFRQLRTGKRLTDLEGDPEYMKARDQVRDVLNAVMLLRMRSTIKERYKEVVIAGKPLVFEDPLVDKVSYKYSGAQYKLFENVSGLLERLRLPHILMANPDSSGALNSLYRLLLFKRVESSLYAFYMSLQNIKAREEELRAEIRSEGWDKVLERFNQSLLENEEDDDLLAGAAMRQGAATEGEENDEFATRLTKEDVLRWIDEDTHAIDSFVREYFHPLLREPSNPLSLDDPKIGAFLETLRGTRFRKALVFTEFIATSEYLAHRLEEENLASGTNLRFTYVNAKTQQDTINSALDRFAPIGRRVKDTDPAREIDLLIATDMLAEGVNLQDADLLINFDLPWNPMRIVQRVGRVNRIGSDNVVRVLNFVPDEVLDAFLNLLKILSSKIAQVTALLGKEMAILSSDEEVIDARDIGEALLRVQSSKTVSEIEVLARNNALFSALEGETDEDFFRLELFVSAKRQHVRPADFQMAPSDDDRIHYYTSLSSAPKVAYRLYEIVGQRERHRDLLGRFWLCARPGDSSASQAHPNNFLQANVEGAEGFSSADLTNSSEVGRMEEILNKEFSQLLEERRDMNSPRNLDKRMAQIGGKQRDLGTLLQKLTQEQMLTESFVDAATKIRSDASQIVQEVIAILRTHQLSQEQARKLNRTLAAKAIEPGRMTVSPAHFADLAQVVFDFYDTVVLKDAALRAHLFTRSEIQGRTVATIYM